MQQARAGIGNSLQGIGNSIRKFNSNAITNFQQVQEAVPGIGRAVQLFKNPLLMLTAAVTGVVMGFRRLSSATSEWMQANSDAAIAEAKLAQVMRNTMKASGEQINSIVELTSAQQKLGVIDNDVQVAGAQELGTYLTKTQSLKKLMPVMNDMLAQQYGLNATQEQAAVIGSMLGKVMDGQVGALSRYGYKFDATQEKILKHGTELRRVAVLSDVVSSAVGGVNAALAATPEGRMKQIENGWCLKLTDKIISISSSSVIICFDIYSYHIVVYRFVFRKADSFSC